MWDKINWKSDNSWFGSRFADTGKESKWRDLNERWKDHILIVNEQKCQIGLFWSCVGDEKQRKWEELERISRKWEGTGSNKGRKYSVWEEIRETDKKNRITRRK